MCTNNYFGGDPAHGVTDKICECIMYGTIVTPLYPKSNTP